MVADRFRLEATRRTVGLPITIIALGIYDLCGFWTHICRDAIAHRGLQLERLVQTMFFTTEGILGTPIVRILNLHFLFLLFGSFLIKTGVGEYFNDLSIAIAGRRVGGPAKVAVFSSALQGTISGSSVANVVTSVLLQYP